METFVWSLMLWFRKATPSKDCKPISGSASSALGEYREHSSKREKEVERQKEEQLQSAIPFEPWRSIGTSYGREAKASPRRGRSGGIVASELSLSNALGKVIIFA